MPPPLLRRKKKVLRWKGVKIDTNGTPEALDRAELILMVRSSFWKGPDPRNGVSDPKIEVLDLEQCMSLSPWATCLLRLRASASPAVAMVAACARLVTLSLLHSMFFFSQRCCFFTSLHLGGRCLGVLLIFLDNLVHIKSSTA